MPHIGFGDIEVAAHRIRPIARRTPVVASPAFDQAAGVRTVFKCENLQAGGAFKIRGAANFLLSLDRGSLDRGVVTFSSGNHAQAVAIAARHLNSRATIVMPSDAPRLKMEATRSLGARVVPYDRLREDREAIGRRIAEETRATLVPPFDHPWIIAGQGTAALELLNQAPDIDALIAPIGGGGLLSGCSIAGHGRNPKLRIFGVEPLDANDTYLSMAAGDRVEIPPPNTIADGLRAPKPGAITFPILLRHVEQVLLVSESEIRAAMKFLLLQLKLLVEPSGAVAAAAVLSGKLPRDVKCAGVLLSGGNVDYELLAAL